MKPLMVRKLVLVGCLCLVLLGVSLFLGACSLSAFVPPVGPTYAPNGSVQSPYPLTVSKGSCATWKIVYDGDEGNPFCAHTLPTQQVGMYIQLSYEGVSQAVCIVSLDARRQVVYVA